MTAGRYWVRHVLRRHVVGVLVLAALAGLGLGLASVALTGARRADTAYAHLQAQTLAPDAYIDAADITDEAFAALASDPDVTALARFSYTPVAPEPLTPGVDGAAFIGLDPDFLDRVYRPAVIEGRLTRPGATDEVIINEAMADAAGIEVGQRVTLRSGFEDPVPIAEVTVVGITRAIFDVGGNSANPTVLLSSAFHAAHREDLILGPEPGLLVRLAGGEADADRFGRAVTDVIGHPPAAMFTASGEATAVERTLTVQTIALTVLGLVVGLATLAAAVQALGRLLDGPLADAPVLIGLGFHPRQVWRLGLLVGGPVIALGPLVATGVTLAGTPQVPTGFARMVDPSIGHHLDAVVLVGLSGTWVLVMAAAAALSGRRAGRPAVRRTEPLHAVLTSLPLRARLGGQAALAPVRARAGAAARSALIAGVAAVAGVTAVTTFTASLERLRDDRSLAGWNFDAVLSGGESSLDGLRAAVGEVEDEPGVASVGWLAIVEVDVTLGDETSPLEGYAFDPDAGAVHPTMRSGRPPLTDEEVAVGLDVLRGAALHMGDRLTVGGPMSSADLTIVGVGPFPEIGNNGDLSTSISLTRATAQRLGAEERGAAALVRLEPGVDLEVLDPFRDRVAVVTPFEATRVHNLGEIGRAPTVLAAFLAALGLAAITHSLLRSLRARRRDLAVLTAMGFRRRDLRATVTWQAFIAAVISLVVGVPLGVMIGRQAWALSAAATGVVEVVVVPGLILVAVAAGVLLAWAGAARLIARVVLRGSTSSALRHD